MGNLGRRIGLSQDKGDSSPGAAGGAVGGGILDLIANGYFERQGGIYNAPSVVASGLVATGGNITEYTDSGTVYRAHVFLSTDTFQVTELAPDPNLGNNVDILLIGGGGGGGGGNSDYGSGGGGAGGFVEVTGYTVAAATYPITIGSGGSQGQGGYPQNFSRRGINGGDTIFTNPSPETITAKGGGGGGTGNSTPSTPATSIYANDGQTGGCGGGGGSYGSPTPIPKGAAGPTNQAPSQPTSISTGTLTQYGFAGGLGNRGDVKANGGGGGGASGTGDDAPPAGTGADGGDGRANTWAYGPTNPVTRAGGGSGGGAPTGLAGGPATPGGGGAGGQMGQPAFVVGPTTGSRGGDGTYSTGSGGGGGTRGPSAAYFGPGGRGGSGICVIRYKIADVTPGIKATGGNVSKVGSKILHTFTNSGTFAITSPISTVEILQVGGGGGGGQVNAGGGGAGVVKYISSQPVNPSPGSYNIVVGAGGAGSSPGPDSNSYIQYGKDGIDSTSGIIPASSGGGGGAANAPYNAARPGGSGGGGADGASGGTGSGDSGHPGATDQASPGNGWGNDGGSATPTAGGGGGGAASVGTNASGGTGGNGGGGIQYSISGATKYYAAGGGGGARTGGTAGTGSNSIGGNGESSPISDAVNGAPAGVRNTGSGGGGGGYQTSPNIPGGGGHGGAGIVIIAYPS